MHCWSFLHSSQVFSSSLSLHNFVYMKWILCLTAANTNIITTQKESLERKHGSRQAESATAIQWVIPVQSVCTVHIIAESECLLCVQNGSKNITRNWIVWALTVQPRGTSCMYACWSLFYSVWDFTPFWNDSKFALSKLVLYTHGDTIWTVLVSKLYYHSNPFKWF